MKISLSRLITGWAFMLAGIVFTILSILVGWWMVLYGIPWFVIGLLVLFNKHEDRIEKRKDLNERKYNK
jgi:membrane-bound ClpP family serine protease